MHVAYAVLVVTRPRVGSQRVGIPDSLTAGMVCTGRITHHDEVSRLKKVYELVKEAQQQIVGELAPPSSWSALCCIISCQDWDC